MVKELSRKEKILQAVDNVLTGHTPKRLDDGLKKQILAQLNIAPLMEEAVAISNAGFTEEALTKFLVEKRLPGKSAHEISAAIIAHWK